MPIKEHNKNSSESVNFVKSTIKMEEIIFTVKESPEGGYEAHALGHSIFTEADTIEELKANVKEAMACHFEENMPKVVRLHLVKDIVFAA